MERIFKNEKSIRELRDNLKYLNIHVIGILEEEWNTKETEAKIFQIC